MAKDRGLVLRGNIYHMQVGAFRGSCDTGDIKLARKIRAKKVAEFAENKHLDIKREEKIKFRDFAKIYFENHCRVNNKSWKRADWVYLNPENPNGLVAYFGDYFLYEIKPLMIEEYKASEIARKIAPATINRVLGILGSLFNRAIDWGKLGESPMKKVKRVKVTANRLRYFEKEELRRLIEKCDAIIRPIVILAAYTGMRRGEIMNLKWMDIDFPKSLICLLDQKNGKKSYIEMLPEVKQALMLVPRNPNGQYIFCYEDGRQMNFTRAFKGALKSAKITGASFHTLRHTFASHLAMSGVDLNTIRELMRHGDMKMTMIYAHLSKDHKSRALKVFGNQMESVLSNNTKTTQSEKEEFQNIVSQIESVS